MSCECERLELLLTQLPFALSLSKGAESEEKLTPKELIEEVDLYFKAFDMIMEDNGLEKIKTIGDAYLAVCGLPNAVDTHGQNTIRAAKAIMEFIDNQRIIKKKDNKIYFDIRIGVHSGPVIAGIVGLKKFAYDIWGDTVNIAARMQSSGEKGRVNVSGDTYQLIKHQFTCTFRGKVAAKNKSDIEMYFVDTTMTSPSCSLSSFLFNVSNNASNTSNSSSFLSENKGDTVRDTI